MAYTETFRMEHLDAAGNVTHVTDEEATVIESTQDLEELFALHMDDDDFSDDGDVLGDYRNNDSDY